MHAVPHLGLSRMKPDLRKLSFNGRINMIAGYAPRLSHTVDYKTTQVFPFPDREDNAWLFCGTFKLRKQKNQHR
jgi:hypothetical protein